MSGCFRCSGGGSEHFRKHDLGIRKSFSDGKASIPYSRFLGYDKGENGKFVINEKEAETVRGIFQLFISGYSFDAICRKLEEKGVKPPAGKDTWRPSTVQSMIRKEKCLQAEKTNTLSVSAYPFM